MTVLVDLARQSLAGLRLLLAATVLLGLVYPAVVLGVAQVAAPWQARGSLVTADGERTTDPARAVGSELLGQVSTDPGLFVNRPSAAGDGYDPQSSYGSNWGPEAPELIASIAERRAAVAQREGVGEDRVPPDAVTASASGLDPHVSPAYAELQVARVAAAQGLDEGVVRAIVDDHTTGRALGTLGEPGVDVLGVNIDVLRAARER